MPTTTSLDPTTRVVRDGGQVTVWHRYGRVSVGDRDRALVAAIGALAGAPVSRDDLERMALDAAGDAADDQVTALARLHWLLDRVAPATVHRAGPPGGPAWLAVTPLTPDVRFTPAAAGDGPVALSRLALLRRRGDRMALESGLAPFRVDLLDGRAVALVGGLAEPARVPDLARALGLDPGLARELVGFLAAAGMTDAADGSADQWAPHELYFHSRSRVGRHDEPFGATFPFAGVRPPVPPVRPSAPGPAVALPRPDLDAVRAADPPLVVAQEGRRSVRGYGPEPMTLEQLGEFLYRVGRVRSVFGPDAARGMPYEGVDRPYPTGGAAGDLEMYVTAHRVAGLPRAAYHYDGWGHRLVRVCADPALLDGLLAGAAQATGGAPAPDALITFTSRFGRLTWKYDAMGYAATLKHVGVAYQTCYLVATAMGLAPCGLGSGDAHLSARVFGLDWHEESSVGEFMIGSLPAWADGTDPALGRPALRAGNDAGWPARAARLLAGARRLRRETS